MKQRMLYTTYTETRPIWNAKLLSQQICDAAITENIIAISIISRRNAEIMLI